MSWQFGISRNLDFVRYHIRSLSNNVTCQCGPVNMGHCFYWEFLENVHNMIYRLIEYLFWCRKKQITYIYLWRINDIYFNCNINMQFQCVLNQFDVKILQLETLMLNHIEKKHVFLFIIFCLKWYSKLQNSEIYFEK